MIARTSLFIDMSASKSYSATPARVACNGRVNGSATLPGAYGVPTDSARREVLYRFPGARRRAEARRASCSRRCFAPDRPIWDKADEIKEVEHKCDFLTHEIIQRLNRTFVTPLDREDIHALARSLDDVMDAIDASATLVRLYRLESVRFGARELARIISACTEQVHLGARRARAEQGARRAGDRDQPSRERGRPHPPAGRQPSCSTTNAIRSSS